MSAANAVLAVAMRDLRAVARSRSQLYSSMLTPLLLLALLGNGVSSGLKPAALGGGSYTAYLVAGTAAMASVFSATFASASYYRDRDSGLLRVLLSSPHSPRVVLTGKLLAGSVVGAAQALLVLAMAAPFVDLGWQHGVAGGMAISLAAILLLNLMLAGIGQALASRVETMQGFHLLMNLALFPLLFVSGAFYPIEGLPRWLELISVANPLSYAVDAVHVAAYAEGSEGFRGLPVDFAVLGLLTAAAWWLGLSRAPQLTWSGR